MMIKVVWGGGSALPNSGATSHIVVDHSKFEHVNENIRLITMSWT